MVRCHNMAIHVTRDYNKAKQDGRVRKTKCVSSNDRTHAIINHAVTF